MMRSKKYLRSTAVALLFRKIHRYFKLTKLAPRLVIFAYLWDANEEIWLSPKRQACLIRRRSYLLSSSPPSSSSSSSSSCNGARFPFIIDDINISRFCLRACVQKQMRNVYEIVAPLCNSCGPAACTRGRMHARSHARNHAESPDNLLCGRHLS